ncbi:MAG: hypothetical protein MI810_02260 [Flavobacteriales bacterium]|nr:hypothetical protein [Flavobacteriales bacterium]
MKQILESLESQLHDQGQTSELDSDSLSALPEKLKTIHSHQLFGADLLAVPAELIIEGDEEEYEKPFSFLDLKEGYDIFESEYREEIPENFIPFGYLHGASEIVLYNKTKSSVHVFHVSDIVDLDWIKYKLKTPICSFDKFIQNLKPQSVGCFMNPSNYSEWTMIEIRDGKLYLDYESQELKNDLWSDYFEICQSLLNEGMEIHYAPKKVLEKFQH